MTQRLFFALALAALLGLAAPHSSAQAPKANCAAAQDTFQSHCMMCHGADGKGYAAIHTPNFTDPKFQASQTDAQLISAVTNGLQGAGTMPSFSGQLTPAQIHDLVHCVVRGFAAKGATAPVASHHATAKAHKATGR